MKITKEVLDEIEKMYINGNSINDIRIDMRKLYGLNVSTDGIRKRLRKITKLRDRREAIKLAKRKHLPKENIIKLYSENQYSLKRIARMFKSDKKTLGKILRENNIDIRNNETSTRLANIKYKRLPFNQNQDQRAYLLGLVEGDMTAFKKSKYTIRVITNTTHLVFAQHIKRKFEDYGYVRIFPSKNRSLGSYMWCVQVDLDNSFDFLLPGNRINEIENCISSNSFFHFLAGFIDSDGSVIIRKSGKYFQSVIRAFGQNIDILSKLRNKLESLGYASSLLKNSPKGGGKTWIYKEDYFVLEIYKKEDVFRLLSILPIEHPEKVSKKTLAMNLINNRTISWIDVEPLIRNLQNEISKEILESISLAEKEYVANH